MISMMMISIMILMMNSYEYVDDGDDDNDLKKISYTAAIAAATSSVPYSGGIVPRYSFLLCCSFFFRSSSFILHFSRFFLFSLFFFFAHRTLCSCFSFLCMSRSLFLSLRWGICVLGSLFFVLCSSSFILEIDLVLYQRTSSTTSYRRGHHGCLLGGWVPHHHIVAGSFIGLNG